MEYYLLILVIVIIICIGVMWYMTWDFRNYPENKVLPLDGTNDELLKHYYYHVIKPSLEVTFDPYDIAHKLLAYINPSDLDISAENLVIGEDLDDLYQRITHKKLDTKYLFSIRELVAKPGQIAIITDEKIRNAMRNLTDYDECKMLHDIIINELVETSHEYIMKACEFRREQLVRFPGIKLDEFDQTYIYLINEPPPDIAAKKTNKGYRTNILCTDLEFKTFLERLESVNLAIF